eukprot:3388418-Rhodomonas_salina.2
MVLRAYCATCGTAIAYANVRLACGRPLPTTTVSFTWYPSLRRTSIVYSAMLCAYIPPTTTGSNTSYTLLPAYAQTTPYFPRVGCYAVLLGPTSAVRGTILSAYGYFTPSVRY